MFHFPMMVDPNGKRRLGRVVKFNRYTVQVKIMKGAKSSFIIKRHKRKHNCTWRLETCLK